MKVGAWNAIMKWIFENKEWLFSGIGVILISSLLNTIIKKNEKYKWNYRFFINLIIGIIIGYIVDYRFNTDNDLRVSVKIYILSILITFIIIIILSYVIAAIIGRIKTKIAIKKLSINDCYYVIECEKIPQYFEVTFTSYPEFEHKWNNILYLKLGSKVEINGKYRIFVKPLALKLVEKKLKRVDNYETKI